MNLLNDMSIILKNFFYFLFFCILLYTSQLSAQSNECAKFKNGIFNLIDKKTGTSYIKRYGNRQSEITDGKKDSTTYVVKWLDDCTYTLTPTQETFKVYPFLPLDALLTVTIIKTKKNSYIQTSSANFSDKKVTSEIIKIE
jgi:hypothetical protein